MFDTHYDLLTKLYISYKRNDFTYIDNWIKNYNLNNVRGLIANLCFMSKDEMNDEYDIDYYKDGDSVIEIFRISVELLKKYIPNNVEVYTSIEGCDYLNDEFDLIELKELGLNAIVPVWNNKNKFGSGNRSSCGLTILGERLISKSIELGIGIDLSHANENTFWDIINYIEKNNLKAHVYASHSNVRNLCDRSRNLTDEQIKAICNLNGFIGVMSNSSFVIQNGYTEREMRRGTKNYNKYTEFLKEKYIEHILYINKLIGNTDNICVSTDDMGFCEIDDYIESPIFDYQTICASLKSKLLKYFSIEDVNKIIYRNASNYLNKISKTYSKGRIK